MSDLVVHVARGKDGKNNERDILMVGGFVGFRKNLVPGKAPGINKNNPMKDS